MKIVFALLAVSSLAMSATGVQLKDLDKNQDGQISVKEATEHAALFNSFKTLDVNQDGQLDSTEVAKFVPAKDATEAKEMKIKS